MKQLSAFQAKVQFVLTDIDDTLTNEGQLSAAAYESLWRLKDAGIHIIPITGRPAGWCEMIARMWPVDGIVGENGAFYFRYHHKKMQRVFTIDQNQQDQNRKKLDVIRDEVLKKIPGTAVASDQFCRINDLAIDFCEDVKPLSPNDVEKIVSIFTNHGAIAKVSSIHVNGWFGACDKLSTSLLFLKNEFHLNEDQIQEKCAFVGDSPNDEPMFSFFKNSFGVANIKRFANDLKSKPNFVADLDGGHGFEEIADRILELR